MNYESKSNLYLYFLMQQNLLISVEKMLMPAELKGLVTWFIYFLGLPWVRYNSTEFHHCRISWAALKKSILNRVNGYHVFQAGIMCLQLWCHQWRIQKFWDTVFSRGFQGRSPKRCNPELWGIIFSDKHVWMDIKIFSLVCSVSVVKHTCSWHDKLTVLCMDNIDKVRLFTMENVIIMYISIVIDIVSGEGSFKITCFFFVLFFSTQALGTYWTTHRFWCKYKLVVCLGLPDIWLKLRVEMLA